MLLAVAGHAFAADESRTVLTTDGERADVVRWDPSQGAQDLHLLVADRAVIERRRRLHADEREKLKQVVLHDVPHRADTVVVAGALFDPDRFGGRDLHVIDVLTCPDRLEDAVREPQDQDVLHRLLAEVVIDAEDLVLAEDLLYDSR